MNMSFWWCLGRSQCALRSGVVATSTLKSRCVSSKITMIHKQLFHYFHISIPFHVVETNFMNMSFWWCLSRSQCALLSGVVANSTLKSRRVSPKITMIHKQLFHYFHISIPFHVVETKFMQKSFWWCLGRSQCALRSGVVAISTLKSRCVSPKITMIHKQLFHNLHFSIAFHVVATNFMKMSFWWCLGRSQCALRRNQKSL